MKAIGYTVVIFLLTVIAFWYWRHHYYCSGPGRNNCVSTSSDQFTIPVVGHGGDGVGFIPASSSDETGEASTFPIEPSSFDITDDALLVLNDPANNRIVMLDGEGKEDGKAKILGYIPTEFLPERVRARGHDLLIQPYSNPTDNDSVCDLSRYRETKAEKCDSLTTESKLDGELHNKQRTIVDAAKSEYPVDDLINDGKTLISFRSIGTDSKGDRFVLVHPAVNAGMPTGPFYVRKFSPTGVLMATSQALSNNSNSDLYHDARVDPNGTVYWVSVQDKQVTIQIWRTHVE